MVCFRAALDSSDGLARVAHARTRGCSPLDRPTATDSKSGEKRETEFSDYPRKGGGKRGGKRGGEGAAKTPIPRMGGWRRGERVGGRRAEGGRATLELSALPSPPAPIAISRARSPPTGGRLLLPPLSIAGQGRSCKHLANPVEDDEMREPFPVCNLLQDGIFA